MSILAGSGNDRVAGGRHADFIADSMKQRGPDRNRFYGDAGRDQIIGSPGDDLLVGGADQDSLSGHPGDDELSGGGADDYLNGMKAPISVTAATAKTTA